MVFEIYPAIEKPRTAQLFPTNYGCPPIEAIKKNVNKRIDSCNYYPWYLGYPSNGHCGEARPNSVG